MCRWFAYISSEEPVLLEDVLVTSQHSLAQMVNEHYLPGLIDVDPKKQKKQSKADEDAIKRNLALNIDGFGLGWYTSARSNYVKGVYGQRPMVYKSISPPLNDYNYRNLCQNTEAYALFGHVRATSGTPVMQVNCHPFIFGRQIFMHNGTISQFQEIRRQVADSLDRDAYLNVAGSTDSEHLAALYMSILTKGRGKESWEEEYPVKEMAKALRKAVGRIIALQKDTLGMEAKPSSFNLAVTDGYQLLTFRFRNHRTEEPLSLYYSTTAGVTLNRKYPGNADGRVNANAAKDPSEHGKHLIVSSEPSTMDVNEWKLIERNHCLMLDKKGNLKIEKIPYDDSWNVDTEDNWNADKMDSWTLDEDEGFQIVPRPSECIPN